MLNMVLLLCALISLQTQSKEHKSIDTMGVPQIPTPLDTNFIGQHCPCDGNLSAENKTPTVVGEDGIPETKVKTN